VRIISFYKLVLVLFIIQPTHGFGQVSKHEFGFRIGVNNAGLSAPNNNSTGSSITRLHAGLYARILLRGKTAFRPEVYYSIQGQRNDYASPVPGGNSIGSVTTTMNYLNVPFMLEWGRRISLQGGPQVGFLLAAKEVGMINSVPVNNELTSGIPRTDFSFVGGIAYSVGRQIQIGVRYQHGLTNLVPQTGGLTRPSQSRVLQISACISF
jgi:hypothetical protein